MARQPLSQEAILTQLDDALTLLQNQRTAGLTDAQRYQEINHQTLEREQVRLSQKYGQDHPRVQKIAARLAYDKNLFEGLTGEISRSKNRMSPLPEQGWRVQGQVFDKTNTPVSNQTVYLSDDRKEARRELGYACSDEGGYYALTLSGEQVDALQGRNLYLTASDANQAVVCRSAEPLVASRAMMEWRTIYLGQTGCQPPFDTEKPTQDDTYLVRGVVTNPRKSPMPNLVVIAYNQDSGGKHSLGEKAVTNADGFYQISYRKSEVGTATSGLTLILSVLDQSGNELYQSDVFPNPERTLTVDIRLPRVIG